MQSFTKFASMLCFVILLFTLKAAALAAYDMDGLTFAASDAYPYHYQLNASAPLLATSSDVFARSADYSDLARVERVNGTLMLISQIDRLQIGTLTGELAATVDKQYPTESQIQANSGAIAKHVAMDKKAGGDPAKLTAAVLAARGESEMGLEKRAACGACFFIVGCSGKQWPNCDTTICVIIICIGV